MKFMLLVLSLLFVSQAWAKWSVTTYNIRNFNKDPDAGPTNLKELERVVKSVKSEVMAFQEVINATAFEAFIKKALPGYAVQVSSCGGFGNQKLALVFDTKVFTFVGQEEDFTFSGGRNNGCGSLRPAFLVTLEARARVKERIVFGLLHLKAGSDDRAQARRAQQYKLLQNISTKYAKQNLILLGDLNTTGYIQKDGDYTRFEQFLSSSNMRSMAEEIGCTNYWVGKVPGPEHQPSILDHIVVRDEMARKASRVQVGSHCAQLDCRPATPEELGVSYKSVSDHCPVQVTFQ